MRWNKTIVLRVSGGFFFSCCNCCMWSHYEMSSITMPGKSICHIGFHIGFHQGSPSGELNWGRKRRSYTRVRGNGAASVTPASSSRPLLTQHTGRNWLNAEIVESCEGVRRRPARSSADVCQRGAVRQRMGEGNTPTPRRRPRLSSGPTSVWRQPSLSAALRGRQRAARSFWRSGCGSRICAMLLRDTATLRLDLPPPRAVLAGSPPDRGRAWWEPWARIHVLNVLNTRHSSLTENAWRSPTRLMEVSMVRSAVLRDRNFSSIESSGSKGPLWSPARTIERSQEGTRGGLEGFILLAPFRNLTMRSCFPRDRPSTASWWAAIAATYTFKVEGDSLLSNLSCRKESTTPIVHLRGSSRREEHQVANRLHFSAVGLPCWRSSSLNDGLYQLPGAVGSAFSLAAGRW